MYQIKHVERRPIINGHEIHVLSGDLCRVMTKDSRELHHGTYAECVQFLRDRALLGGGISKHADYDHDGTLDLNETGPGANTHSDMSGY